MTIPELIELSSLDDVQSIDADLGSLKAKFIQPIDELRSYSAPNVRDTRRFAEDGKAAQQELNSSGMNFDLRESRAHTFYRMLGFPVMDVNGSFYNPGFNPSITKDDLEYNERIAKGVPNTVRNMQENREASARKRINTFNNTSTNSSIFSLSMGVPDGQRKFNVRDEAVGILEEDKQEIKIPERKSFLEKNYLKPNGQDLTFFHDSFEHMIRPMMVDPVIERTVKPQRRIIGQPFLSDTELEPNVNVLRPGIEFILRLRLLQSNDQEGNTIDFDDTIIDQEDINRLLISRTTVEILNIDLLVKTIKAVVKRYVEALNSLKKVQKNINWTPISNTGGPENGTVNSNFIIVKNKNSQLEERINQLIIKQINAKRQFSLGDGISSNDFAISQFENLEILFEEEILEAKSQKANCERVGSNNLKYIELATGEVSGFGLLDILAIYTALWSIDLDTLVSLLDNNAFDRLYQNKDLRAEPVVTRKNNGAVFNGSEALAIFENQVFSILSFIDRIYDLNQGNPKNAAGGNIPRD